jgi:general stress protein 26
LAVRASAQDSTGQQQHLIDAARAIMDEARFCSLVTLDSEGSPQVRIMDPFAPEGDMVVWLGTNRNSRKVAEIRSDPRVALHYAAPASTGYVTLHGHAEIIDDSGEKAARWKPEWESLYTDRDADYVLIRVVPESLEILDMASGIAGDPVTWKTPTVLLPDPGGDR